MSNVDEEIVTYTPVAAPSNPSSGVLLYHEMGTDILCTRSENGVITELMGGPTGSQGDAGTSGSTGPQGPQGDSGGDQIWGSERTNVEDLSESSTTSTTYQTKLQLVTGSIPTGDYRVGWSYRWRHSSASNDFRGRVRVDGSVITEHQQEPKDSGSDQKQWCGGFFYQTLTAASHTIDIQWSRSSSGTSFIADARLEIWRVA